MTYRYFYDCEFIEDGRTVDLVSIGVVDEHGREFYAVSTEFDDSRAVPWVRRNVLDKLPSPGDPAWRSRERIRDDLYEFLVAPLRAAGTNEARAVGLVRRVRPRGAGPALGRDAGPAAGDPAVHQGPPPALGRPGQTAAASGRRRPARRPRRRPAQPGPLARHAGTGRTLTVHRPVGGSRWSGFCPATTVRNVRPAPGRQRRRSSILGLSGHVCPLGQGSQSGG